MRLRLSTVIYFLIASTPLVCVSGEATKSVTGPDGFQDDVSWGNGVSGVPNKAPTDANGWQVDVAPSNGVSGVPNKKTKSTSDSYMTNHTLLRAP
jgi:hypothetical protein